MIITNFENLIDEDEAINTKTMLLIDDLRRKKHKFIVTTHRNLEEILSYNKSYPFIDYIVSSFGNYIYDVKKNNFLFKNNISLKDQKKIDSIFKENIIKKDKYNAKVYQIKMKKLNMNKFNIEKINVNYYYTNEHLYLVSNKLTLKEAIKKLINKKDNNIIIIAYDILDCTLFSLSNNNYYIENTNLDLKKISKEKYFKENSIDEILAKLNI